MGIHQVIKEHGKPGDYVVLKIIEHPETKDIGEVMTFVPGEVFEAQAEGLMAMLGPEFDQAEQIVVKREE